MPSSGITHKKNKGQSVSPSSSKGINHGRIVLTPDQGQCLDTVQLGRLEQSFREWVDRSSRADIRRSRRRVLVIFLLIRYTGAKLNEVLALNPFTDIDADRPAVFFRNTPADARSGSREVQISASLYRELRNIIAAAVPADESLNNLAADPAFVRRKFYERAENCGFPKRLGGPEIIRKARAVELMQGNVPLPAVQMLLGHSTPNLTSSYVAFSEDDIRQVTRLFIERESTRKTSARNSFYGKIRDIRRGDIQTLIGLVTLDGHLVTTVVTNDSLDRLGLRQGRLVTAEVKAPWVILQKGGLEPNCSAENRFSGVIEKITRGRVNTECTVRISENTVLCAIVSTTGSRRLALGEGDAVWVFFNSFSVVLQVD